MPVRPAPAGIVLGLLYGLAAAGTSAVAVVLPAMGRDLGVGAARTAWVLTGYAVAFGLTTAVFGRAADALGTRGPLLLGAGLLAGGAVAGALAPSLPVLVAARVLQGAGAGSAAVLATAIATSTFDGPSRARVLGLVGAVVVVVSSLGPLLGGVLELLAGWRGAVALPAVVLLALPAILPLTNRDGTGEPLDSLGAVLTVVAAVGPVLLLQSVAAGPAVAVAGVLCLALGVPALVAHVRRRPAGFLPRAVVTNPVVVRAALAGSTVPAAYFAALLTVPALLADRQGWSALITGLALVPAAFTGVVGSRAGGRLIGTLGADRTAGAGMLLVAAGTAVCAALPGVPVPAVLGVAAITAGYGLAQPALVARVAGSVDPAVRGSALGLFTLLFLLGGGVGSAVIGGTGDLIGLPAALGLVAVPPLVAAAATLRRSPACEG